MSFSSPNFGNNPRGKIDSSIQQMQELQDSDEAYLAGGTNQLIMAISKSEEQSHGSARGSEGAGLAT